jgi:hypothetical protein
MYHRPFSNRAAVFQSPTLNLEGGRLMAGTRSRDWPRCGELLRDGTPCTTAVATLGKRTPARRCSWHIVQRLVPIRELLIVDDVTAAVAELSALLPPVDH